MYDHVLGYVTTVMLGYVTTVAIGNVLGARAVRVEIQDLVFLAHRRQVRVDLAFRPAHHRLARVLAAQQLLRRAS